MKKLLAILMVSFLVGITAINCTQDENLELERNTQTIEKDSIIVPPGGIAGQSIKKDEIIVPPGG